MQDGKEPVRGGAIAINSIDCDVLRIHGKK